MEFDLRLYAPWRKAVKRAFELGEFSIINKATVLRNRNAADSALHAGGTP